MRPLQKAVGIALAVCVLTGLAVALLPVESRAQQPVTSFVCDPDPAPELKAKDLDVCLHLIVTRRRRPGQRYKRRSS
jgi:hypothetical protein